MTTLLDQTISAAQRGALVLTANRRLYRHLRSGYAARMQQEGKAVWATPEIYPFDGWLVRCLDLLGEGWRLLSVAQQHHLWEEEILRASRGTALELMNIDKITETAVRAHNLLSDYDITLPDHGLTDDQQAFAAWRRAYQAHCETHELLDQGGLAQHVVRALAKGDLAAPAEVLLAGFDQLPPGVQALSRLVGAQGGRCHRAQWENGPGGAVLRFAAADERDEAAAMARWVRHQLEHGATSIGVVVPDLQRRRTQIERMLRQQIDPRATLHEGAGEGAFSLSLGSSLAHQGVISAALGGLAAREQIGLDQLSALLRSPFIAGSVSEADQRARFDQRLRSFGQESFSLAGVARLAGNFGGLPLLEQLFSGMLARPRTPRSPRDWAGQFAHELKLLGWPGEVTLSSTSYQAVAAWYDKVLNALASLAALTAQLSRGRALRILRQLAGAVDFQPESASGPVQVVGLLESSGLDFEHLWVMGLTEGTVPAAPRPNPFIPYDLQTQLQMPHADFARELEFAEQVLLRLRHAADRIVFSYPRRSGDTEIKPSPLIAGVGVAGEPPQAPATDFVSLLGQLEDPREHVEDTQGPPLAAVAASGGTRLLQDQAHCPFRAFVHHRLGVRAFDQSVPGLSPVVRGDLVHRTLEGIWTHLRDQSALLALDEAELGALVGRCATAALADVFAGRGAPPEPLLQLEQQRIVSLVQEWLVKIEAERPPFAVVATEQEQVIPLGPLSLRLKIDRIDRLSNGGELIIDYKTGGDLRTTDFLTSPLIEPQLPCYAVAGDRGTASVGVVVARVRRGDCKLLGIVSEAGLLGKVKAVPALEPAVDAGISDWSGLLAFWHRQITGLAEDYAAGHAQVRPFDRQKSCRYCDLPGLCRIGALDGDANGASDDDTSGDDDDN